jgi:hypothetical protein
MAVSRFKHSLAGVICAVAIAGAAHADAPQPLTPTQEHRQWAAEQMIKRVVERMGRTMTVCDRVADWMPKLSEQCINAVIGAYPILNIIREVASSGDDARWVAAVYAIHTLEDKTEASLQASERK